MPARSISSKKQARSRFVHGHLCGLLLACLSQSPAVAATDTADTADDAIPPQAAEAGYRVRTFGPQIDYGSNWFDWSFYGANPQPRDAVRRLPDGSLFVSGKENNDSGGSVSSARQTKRGKRWRGSAFGGGAYFEAELSFKGQGKGPYGNGGPAFWMLDIEHTSQGPYRVHWPGKPESYNDYFEIDVMEYDVGEFAFQNGIGHWYGDHAAGTFTSTSNPVQEVPGAAGSVRVPSHTDFSKPHRYGCLWVPAARGSRGFLKFYFDGHQTGKTFYWRYDDPAHPFAPPPINNDTAMSGMDQRHMFLILGTGTDQPMTVQSVSVWQKSTADRLDQ